MALSTDLCIAGKGRGTNLQEAKRKKKKVCWLGWRDAAALQKCLTTALQKCLPPALQKCYNIHIY